MLEINGFSFTGNPCRVVTATWNGRTFTAGERVWAALFVLQAWLDKHHPGLYVYVIQGAYNTGVAASAHTHDFDGTLDVAIINRRTGRRVWLRARRWLRALGWAAWWRHTGSWWSPSSWHFHMNLLGTVEAGCPVGTFIPGQNADYYEHRTGLVGHVLEPGWYPPDIDKTIFDYPAWLEAHMPLNKDDLDAIDARIAQRVDALSQAIGDQLTAALRFESPDGKSKWSLGQYLKSLYNRTKP